ncbi:hypothetical protein RYX36_005089 [Vicia faba]
MEQNLNATLLTTAVDPEDVRVIQQEDFEHDLIRLSSLSSALNQAKEKKQNLQRWQRRMMIASVTTQPTVPLFI